MNPAGVVGLLPRRVLTYVIEIVLLDIAIAFIQAFRQGHRQRMEDLRWKRES